MTLPVKVLLAEDDADDRRFFQVFLADHIALRLLPPVENGIEAILSLDSMDDENQLPNAIILDQNMPKRNGLQTLQYLKASERYARIPAMIYSTYVDDRLVQEGLKFGAALVLSKPSDKAGYHAMIDSLLKVLP